MRRRTNRRPRTARDMARYNLTVALLALVATLLLVALVAPGTINVQAMLALLVPPLMLSLGYYFKRRQR